MIEITHYRNQGDEEPFEAGIAAAYHEVQGLLTGVPDRVNIYFGDYGIIPGSGIGGYAWSNDTITVTIDPDFPDKAIQHNAIRPCIFHEGYHLQQGFTKERGPFSAIENVMYEGMATVFEREHCKIRAPYGEYQNIAEEQLEQWLNDLRELGTADYQSDYREWKFYHSQYKEHWIVYRVGTWATDQVLGKRGLNILDLSTKTASEVFDMYIH